MVETRPGHTEIYHKIVRLGYNEKSFVIFRVFCLCSIFFPFRLIYVTVGAALTHAPLMASVFVITLDVIGDVRIVAGEKYDVSRFVNKSA